jgi:hypothetical protein
MGWRSDRKKNVNGLDPHDVAKSVRAIKTSIKGRVHKSVLIRVSHICALVEQALPRANELGAGSEEMYILSKMTTDYLPRALNPYLQMPRQYAERNALADGRTATQVLCSQLDVMYAQMWQVNNAILQADGDKLLANGRFLDDKFGPNNFDLPPAKDQQARQPPPQYPQQPYQSPPPKGGHPTRKPADPNVKTNMQLAGELISITAHHAYERFKQRKKG